MQSVTIGNPDAYLRLTAAPSPGEHLPGGHLPGGHLPGGHLPGGHLPRGFLKASLHTEEVTATRVLDLRRDHAGLAQFFDNAANQLDGPMVWGTRTELELTFQRARPDYLVLSITLQNRGWHQRAWTLETAVTIPTNQLEQLARDLKSLTG